MSCVIRIVSMADGRPSEFDGKYLWSWNIEAPGASAYAAAIAATPHPTDAHQFEDPVEALEVWRSQSTKVPTRPDGAPNRPLTAYTIEVMTLDTALQQQDES